MAVERVVKIFISSPADVRPERLITERVIRRLAREFAYHFKVEPYLWEREPLLASASFQELILPPRQTDIVVVILWSRLGVPLDVKTHAGPLSGREVTGTEWEFEDALAGARERKLPDLLLYRKTAEVQVTLGDRSKVEEQQRQAELVEEFMRRWTRDADDKGFTAASWPFSDGADFERQVEEHLRGLLRKRLAGGDGDAAATVRWFDNPYRGLQSFEPEHEQIFFGRSRARNEVRELLTRRAESGTAFVLVMGASGSGKSSLVRAGLVPELREAGMVGRAAHVRHAITRPSAFADGAGVLEGLAAALLGPTALPELAAPPLQYTAAALAELLRKADDSTVHALRQGLSAAGLAAGVKSGGEARLLLVIDQLEELFTAEGITPEARAAYVAALQALARSGLAWVIATMRSDFFDRLEQLPVLAQLSEQGRYLLTAPDDSEIGQIVRQPAREAGLSFEVDDNGKSLDEVIRGVAASDGASLPLLEYLLDQLWQRRTDDGHLSFAAYRELGGLEGAIGRRAESVFAAQPADVQAALPRVLRALVTVGQGARAAATARYAERSQFAAGSAEARLVEALQQPDARLIVSDGGRLRIAHEAVLSHWERARHQIADDRADLQLRARLEDAAGRWRGAAGDGRDSLLLVPGLPLSEAEDLLARRGDELAPELREFVEASLMRARYEQRRSVRRLQAIAGIMLVLLIGVAAGGVAAWRGEQRAEVERDKARVAEREAANERDVALIAQSRYVAQLARQRGAAGDRGTALAVMLEVMPEHLAKPDRPFDRLAEAVLMEQVFRQRGRAVILGHQAVILRAVASPDGRLIATASWDGTAALWDALTARSVGVLRGHGGPVVDVAFSPDGRRLLTASRDGTARVWDVASRGELGVYRHTPSVSAAAFSPDGRIIATAGEDFAVRLWNADEHRLVATLEGHSAPARRVAFARDGTRLLSLAEDETARIWDLRTRTTVSVLRGHEGYVTSAALSPDGLMAATTASDGTIRLWDVATGAEKARLFGHDDEATVVVFSPDGKRLATASHDATARIWDAQTGTQLHVLRGHRDEVLDVAFSRDGALLATASRDETLRIWQTRDGMQVGVIVDHWKAVAATAFLPSDRHVLSLSIADGSVQVTEVDEPLDPAVTLEPSADIKSLVFSDDGTTVATVSQAVTQLWDAKKGRLLRTLAEAATNVTAAAFAPDGKRIATATADGSITIWQTDSGTVLRRLKGSVVVSASFSADGERILGVTEDGRVVAWRIESGEERVIAGHVPRLGWQAFSADRRQVTLASKSRVVHIWDADTGQLLLQAKSPDDAMVHFDRSPDGARIATISTSGTARVWNIRSEKTEFLLEQQSRFTRIAFSPDGLRLATASEDRTLRLWDAETGRLLNELKGHRDTLVSVAFAPSGTSVASIGSDRSVRLWPLVLGQRLIDEACSMVSRPLSPLRRAEFFLEPREGRCGPK